MSIAMTIQALIQRLLTRIGNAVRRDESREDAPAPVLTTVDHWVAEEQWLTGFPVSRSEHFGWLWYRGP
jgi:hypothetical protein